MKKNALLLALAVGASATLSALPDWKVPGNWSKQYSSSAPAMEIRFDEKNKAVLFLAEFSAETKDRWLYPRIKADASDRKAKKLLFEFKGEQNPDGRGYKNRKILFLDMKGKVMASADFQEISKEFQKAVIDLTRVRNLDLSKLGYIRIGCNVKDAQEIAFWLRNLRFE